MNDPLRNAFIVFFGWLPSLVAAIVIVVVGYLAAKLFESLVQRGLKSVGLDRRVHTGQGGAYIKRVIDSPSALVGTLTFWVVMLAALSLAVTTLGIGTLNSFVSVIYGYIPNVLAAALIFLVAGAISAGASAFVAKTMGETMTGKVVATAAPVIIMSVAGFMILEQLRIAPGIVMITYTLILGAVALGMALAFGLGGREVASDLLRTTYRKTRENADQVKADVQQGAARQRDLAGAFYEKVDDEKQKQQQTPPVRRVQPTDTVTPPAEADDYVSE